MLVIKLTNADVREVHRIRQCHVDSSWSSRSRKVLSVKPVVTEICGFIVVQVRVVQVLGYAVRQFAPQSHKNMEVQEPLLLKCKKTVGETIVLSLKILLFANVCCGVFSRLLKGVSSFLFLFMQQ